jgi:hypothetical protein
MPQGRQRSRHRRRREERSRRQSSSRSKSRRSDRSKSTAIRGRVPARAESRAESKKKSRRRSATLPADVICSFCHKSVSVEERYRKCLAHKKCYCAKRCLDTMASSSQELKSQMDVLRKRDPEKFGVMLQALRSDDYNRSGGQREKAKHFVIEFSRSTAISRKSGYLLLTLNQYTVFMEHTEGMSKRQAKRSWQLALDKSNAYTEEDEDGELVLAVKKPTEINLEDKIEEKRRRSTEGDPDGDDANALQDGIRLALKSGQNNIGKLKVLKDSGLFSRKSQARLEPDDDASSEEDGAASDTSGSEDASMGDPVVATPPATKRRPEPLGSSTSFQLSPRPSRRAASVTSVNSIGSNSAKRAKNGTADASPSRKANDDSGDAVTLLWKKKRSFKLVINTKIDTFKVTDR